MIVPNMSSSKSTKFTVYTPFEDAKIAGYQSYVVTDLLTDQVITKGSPAQIAAFKVEIPHEYQGVYLIEGMGEKTMLTAPSDSETKEIVKYISQPSVNKESQEEISSVEETSDENESIPEKPKKPSNTAQKEKDGKNIYFIIAVAAAAVVLAAILLGLVWVRKKRK